MKKLVLAAVAVFAIGNSAFAQQEVKFGPKAGVNFSNISGQDNAEMKTGFHVGAVAEIKFNEKFSIQPEVLYSAQGAKYEYFVGNNKLADATQSLDYINIPIMAKYYIVDGFSVEAGPQVGFLTKAESKFENAVTGSSLTSGDNKDNFKSVDFGVNFGLAYDLPSGLFINARYNLGLSKIAEDVTVGNTTVSAPDHKNSVIQVGLGYKF